MPGSRFQKTADFQKTFSTFDPAQTGTCRIRIFEPVASASSGPAVIVASQDPSSAASITNFAEELARDVIGAFRSSCGCNSRNPSVISRTKAIWIEHYPPGTMLGLSQERFCTVAFQTLSNGTLTDPQWEAVPRTFVERSLLGISLGE